MKHHLLIRNFLFALVVLAISCSHYDELMTKGAQSETGVEESHNPGQNCMQCHNQNGNEAVREGGWWNIAGTAFEKQNEPAQEGFIQLWTGPNQTGALVYELPIDKLGNFYTAKIVDFKGGFYPVLLDKDKKWRKKMGSLIQTGACNSCHGITTSVISF